MRHRLFQVAALIVVALFAVTLGEYLVLTRVGFRMLPLESRSLEIAFYVLGTLTLTLAVLAYWRPREHREGFFRLAVSFDRLVLAFCLMPVMMTLAGFFGAYFWFADLFAHFRLQYVVALLLGASMLALVRRPRWAVWVVAAAVVNLAVLSPQLVRWPTAEAGSGAKARFVFSNVNKWNENHQALVSFLKRTDPDVIVLAEINERWLDAIGPFIENYPYSIASPLENDFGIGAWSRFPIVSGKTVHFASRRQPSVVATLDVEGEEVVLIGTHPVAPRNARYASMRNRQLRAVAERVRAEDAKVVLLGDLNTTPWGHGFRDLVARSGLKDTSRGQGLQWSWPAGLWPLAIPIDHALVSKDVRVHGRWIGPDVGSDHYPVVLDAGF